MRKCNGFSIIELMIVLAILGAVSAIASPYLTKYAHNANLKTAGRDIAGDIFNAKQNATAQAVHYKIVFDKDANNYKILRGGQNSTDAYDEANGITKNLASIAEYIEIDSVTPVATHQIVIQPRGTTSGSSIRLKNDKGSTVVITTSLMGKVSVQYALN